MRAVRDDLNLWDEIAYPVGLECVKRKVLPGL